MSQTSYRILETAQQILFCYYIYYLTVLHFGQVEKVGAVPIHLSIAIALAGFIGMIVQVCSVRCP